MTVERQPDVAAAIRRSREVRKARLSRRRRSVAIAAALSFALSGAAILSLDSVTGADMVHAAVASAESLGDLIGQRSPGRRVQAQLTKTRHARALARVLPRARSHAAPRNELAKILLTPPAEIPVELAPAAPLVAFSGPTPVALILAPSPAVGGGGGVPPPGGGGTIVSPPTTTDTYPSEPREPLPSAVPEPGTWALMLMGFGLIGWRARGSQRAAPARSLA